MSLASGVIGFPASITTKTLVLPKTQNSSPGNISVLPVFIIPGEPALRILNEVSASSVVSSLMAKPSFLMKSKSVPIPRQNHFLEEALPHQVDSTFLAAAAAFHNIVRHRPRQP